MCALDPGVSVLWNWLPLVAVNEVHFDPGPMNQSIQVVVCSMAGLDDGDKPTSWDSRLAGQAHMKPSSIVLLKSLLIQMYMLLALQ